MLIPKLPIGDTVEFAVDWTEDHFGVVLDLVSDKLDFLISALKDALLFLPPEIFILALSIFAYFAANVISSDDKKHPDMALATSGFLGCFSKKALQKCLASSVFTNIR